MDYNSRYSTLQLLRRQKFAEYVKAYSIYIQPAQKVISFKEVSDLKAELDELYTLLIALENAYHS